MSWSLELRLKTLCRRIKWVGLIKLIKLVIWRIDSKWLRKNMQLPLNKLEVRINFWVSIWWGGPNNYSKKSILKRWLINIQTPSKTEFLYYPKLLLYKSNWIKKDDIFIHVITSFTVLSNINIFYFKYYNTFDLVCEYRYK